MKSKLAVKSIILKVVLELVWRFVVALLAGLLALIPLVGWILALIIEIGMFFSLIAFLFNLLMDLISHVEITETHICGRAGLKTFDLTWDKVKKIEKKTYELVIYKVGRKKPYRIDHIANEDALYAEYRRIKPGAQE